MFKKNREKKKSYDEIKMSLAQAYVDMIDKSELWEMSKDEYFDLLDAFEKQDWVKLRDYDRKLNKLMESTDGRVKLLETLFGKKHKVVYSTERGGFKFNKPVIDWLKSNGCKDMQNFITDMVKEWGDNDDEGVYDFISGKLIDEYDVCGLQRHDECLIRCVEELGTDVSGLAVKPIMGKYYRIVESEDGTEFVDVLDLTSYVEI